MEAQDAKEIKWTPWFGHTKEGVRFGCGVSGVSRPRMTWEGKQFVYQLDAGDLHHGIGFPSQRVVDQFNACCNVNGAYKFQVSTLPGEEQKGELRMFVVKPDGKVVYFNARFLPDADGNIPVCELNDGPFDAPANKQFIVLGS